MCTLAWHNCENTTGLSCGVAQTHARSIHRLSGALSHLRLRSCPRAVIDTAEVSYPDPRGVVPRAYHVLDHVLDVAGGE